MPDVEGDPVEVRLGETLRETGGTVAVAETCTGGAVASRITDVPGSSDYFDRAFVPYSYDSLRTTLGVPRETLDEHGAVSAPVARDLARRARDLADATWGLSTTGVLGPAGGDPERPVGTAYVGVAYAGPWGTETSHATAERHDLEGDRTEVKARIVEAALGTLHGRVSSHEG